LFHKKVDLLVEERVFLNRSLFREAERIYNSKSALAGATTVASAPTPAAKQEPAPAKNEDDFDLFEEEEESEEKKRITEERLKAYASKKSNSIVYF
jgi:hypothetical protein